MDQSRLTSQECVLRGWEQRKVPERARGWRRAGNPKGRRSARSRSVSALAPPSAPRSPAPPPVPAPARPSRRVVMEVEQKQADLVQQFVLLAGSARGRAAVELITHATSHPQLFAFSELLASPHIAEVRPCLPTSIFCLPLAPVPALARVFCFCSDSVFPIWFNFIECLQISFSFGMALFQLKGSEHSSALDLLRLFAHGTWSDYKSRCSYAIV